ALVGGGEALDVVDRVVVADVLEGVGDGLDEVVLLDRCHGWLEGWRETAHFSRCGRPVPCDDGLMPGSLLSAPAGFRKGVVIPAKAGIQCLCVKGLKSLGPRLRGDDG